MSAEIGGDVKGVGEGVTEKSWEYPACGGVAVGTATGVSKTGVDAGRTVAAVVAVAVGAGPDVIGVSGWPHASNPRRLRDRVNRPR